MPVPIGLEVGIRAVGVDGADFFADHQIVKDHARLEAQRLGRLAPPSPGGSYISGRPLM